jgi:hypothetical protein
LFARSQESGLGAFDHELKESTKPGAVPEEELIADAEVRGWPREVERHQAAKRRIRELLSDLDEDLQSR